MNLLDELGKGKLLVSDGAWGTFLQAKGLQGGECPELWNVTRRGDVLDIAKSYIAAGSDIIETNSFGGSRIKLAQYGLGDRTVELNEAASAISREAAGSDKIVAGSVGPTGKMLLMGDVTEEELYNTFSEQVTALAKGGADMIIIETMLDITEAALAVRAARENTTCVVAATMTFSKTIQGEYRTMMGVSPAEMVIALKDAGAHVVGSNCGNGIADMKGIVDAIRLVDQAIPVLIQANAGIPELVDGNTVFRETPGMMASHVRALVSSGACIIGGCCGTTPDHIRAIVSEVRK
ncbi:MAG: homocysteine S-methyltransferase family protein [Bacteroidales bacterium]